MFKSDNRKNDFYNKGALLAIARAVVGEGSVKVSKELVIRCHMVSISMPRASSSEVSDWQLDHYDGDISEFVLQIKEVDKRAQHDQVARNACRSSNGGLVAGMALIHHSGSKDAFIKDASGGKINGLKIANFQPPMYGNQDVMDRWCNGHFSVSNFSPCL